jgi:hypothetical protein
LSEELDLHDLDFFDSVDFSDVCPGFVRICVVIENYCQVWTIPGVTFVPKHQSDSENSPMASRFAKNIGIPHSKSMYEE